MADSDETKDALNDEESKETNDTETDDSKDTDTGESNSKDLFKTIEEAGLKDKLTEYVKTQVQSESDRRVNQALKTQEKKLEDKLRKENEDAEKLKEKENMKPADREVADLKDMVKSLTESVTSLVSSSKQEKLDVKKEAALKAAKLPVELKAYITVDKEEDIASHIPTLQNIFAGFKKVEIKEWVEGQGRGPLRSTATSDEEARQEVRDYLKEKQTVSHGGAASEQLGIKN